MQKLIVKTGFITLNIISMGGEVQFILSSFFIILKWELSKSLTFMLQIVGHLELFTRGLLKQLLIYVGVKL